jgi:hypothetical protein
MPKRSKANKKPASQPETLKGWKEIAESLGEPISVMKRWRSEGMPAVEQGRCVTSSAEQLSAWLGRESGKPVHVVTPEMDLECLLGAMFHLGDGIPMNFDKLAQPVIRPVSGSNQNRLVWPAWVPGWYCAEFV